jgi:hypothetical protein
MEKYLLKKSKPSPQKITTEIAEIAENTLNEQAYLNSLSDKELKSYQIAKTHLKTSFNLSKAQGYTKWSNSSSH